MFIPCQPRKNLSPIQLWISGCARQQSTSEVETEVGSTEENTLAETTNHNIHGARTILRSNLANIPHCITLRGLIQIWAKHLHTKLSNAEAEVTYGLGAPSPLWAPGFYKYTFFYFIFIIILFLFIVQEMRYFGVDWDGPLSDEDELQRVEVPSIPVPLEDGDLEELKQTVCPTLPSDDHGLGLYHQALQFVQSKLFF